MPADGAPRKAKKSRLLVVDASVVRAAGSIDAVHPDAMHCRDILQTILEVCHRVHVTTELREEWKSHASRFARLWLRSMYSRKKVVDAAAVGATSLGAEVAGAAYLSDAEKEALFKDRHLVEAASAADKVVLSLDGRTGAILRKIAEHYGGLTDHLWIDPTKDFAETSAWLAERGKPRPDWQLAGQARRAGARTKANPT